MPSVDDVHVDGPMGNDGREVTEDQARKLMRKILDMLTRNMPEGVSKSRDDDMEECVECGDEFSVDELMDTSDGLMCEDCAEGRVEKGYLQMCWSCQRLLDADIMIDTKHGPMCKECIQQLSETAEVVKAEYSDTPWNSPESSLSAESYASVCLIDINPSGQKKIKSLCHLPIRSRPGAPINKGALRNAAARINQVKGISDEIRTKAQKRLNSLERSAGVGESKDIEKSAQSEIEWNVQLVKSDPELHLVTGIVLRPNVPDSQGDVMSEEQVRKAAHKFMRDSMTLDYQHRYSLEKAVAVPVESFIAPNAFVWNDVNIVKGDWILTSHVPDDGIWNEIKTGGLGSYSIRGWGKRKPRAK